MPEWEAFVRERLGARGLTGGREREITTELAQQLEQAYQETLASGATEADARLSAEGQIADWAALGRAIAAAEAPVKGRIPAGIRNTLDTEPLRVRPGGNMLADLLQDLRYALRALRRAPGFALVATLTLALGIGANTAIFTLLDAVVFRTLPVAHPQQLVLLTDPDAGGIAYGTSTGRRELLAYSEYTALRDRNHVFNGLLAAQSGGRTLRQPVSWGADAAEVTTVKMVSANYFPVLGISAYRGRTFAATESDAATAQPVAVMGYAYWRQRFALDPGVVGRAFRLHGHAFTVIGIAPPGFNGETNGLATALFVPLALQAEAAPGDDMLHDPPGTADRYQWLQVIGRLKPGVTLAQANADANLVFSQAVPRRTTAQAGQQAEFLKLASGSTGASLLRSDYANPLWILLGLVGVVLLVAVSNLASLLLARAVGRHKEIGVRLALGARRGRLLRQLLTESLLLAFLGGGAGWLLAVLGDRVLLHMVSASGAITLDLHPDPAVLAFTLGLCVLSGLLFGLAPAWRMSRLELNASLTTRDQNTASRLPLGKLLIVGQVALSVVLLVGAGLLARSLAKLSDIPLGYNPNHLTLFRLDAGALGYQGPRAVELYQAVLDHLARVPGVGAVSLSENGLFSGTESADEIAAEGDAASMMKPVQSLYDEVGPGYFHTIGIPILAGRDIGLQDTDAAPRVAVVNATFARRFFAGRNPLGRHITLRSPDDTGVSMTIVGVVADAKYHRLAEVAPPRFYSPYFHPLPGESAPYIEVRASGDLAAIAGGLRAALRAVDPNLPAPDLHSMTELVDRSIATPQILATLAGAFGALALVLIAIGLFGVMSYAVGRRSHEIGVRMALGANGGQVLGMILREVLIVAGVGIAVGIPASVAAGHLLAQQLYAVHPDDPWALTAAAGLPLAVALVAGYLPARRASRVDPLVALRYE